jgi:serine protease Do
MFSVIVIALLSIGIVNAKPNNNAINNPQFLSKEKQNSYVVQSPPSSLQGFADIVAPLMPAVVNISAIQKPQKFNRSAPIIPEEVERLLPPGTFDEDFFDNRKKFISLGSGFIIDSTGYIVTNYHVIADSNDITVKLNTGTSMKAEIIGVDKETDIALLKVNSKKPLSFAKFGDSDKARVGDWIIAIGNPFGLGGTVTTGIVSANGRDISSEGVVDNFIQTDAAINRGNSGGPMFNMKGEVIGINTQILSPPTSPSSTPVNIGIGFATPSSIMVPVIKQLKSTGKVVSGFLGVTMQHLTEELAESMGMETDKGALVIEVRANTPASRAGILVGDLIISFDGKMVKSIKELQRLVRNSIIGEDLSMVVIREKTQKQLVVKLEKAPQGQSLLKTLGEKFDNLSKFSSHKKIMGAAISKLDDKLRTQFGIDPSVNGLVLLEVSEKSSWYAQGFSVGDVLLIANGKPLTSVEQLEKEIKSYKTMKKKSISLFVQKQNMKRFMSLSIE